MAFFKSKTSGASAAKVEFGLSLDAQSGFTVSRGRSDAHFVISLEFDAGASERTDP